MVPWYGVSSVTTGCSGQVAGQTTAHLYEALRRYVNFFQPSFKLIDKTRDGATTVKRYSQPTTPCE